MFGLKCYDAVLELLPADFLPATHLVVPLTWRPRGLSKSVISRDIIGVAPSSVVTSLLITYLLSPLGLQVPRTEILIAPL